MAFPEATGVFYLGGDSMGGVWKYYRFDFSSSSGKDNRAPDGSYEWELGASNWRQRATPDAPIDISDAERGLVYFQIDTASTENGSNDTTNADINFLGALVAQATTGQLGGRFDNSTAGYFFSVSSIGDSVIKTGVIGYTSGQGFAPPWMKLRYDNNTTKAGYCSVFVGFKRG